MSKALLKSIKREWIAFRPSGVLSVQVNQVRVILIRADTVDRPCEKAC